MEHQHIQINSKKARQFKCQSCGGELELKNNRSVYVSCPYCGSVADASSEAYKVLTRPANPAKFPPMSFLKLGMIGNIGGVMFSITGRTRWQSKYKEYWQEEGDDGYSNETWIFDEWILIGDNGAFKTIVEDSEGYYMATQLVPKYPTFPGTNTQVQNFFEKGKERVREFGNSSILFFEGESTYLVQLGSNVGFSEYRHKNASYSAEWRYTKDNQIKEIEFFRERKIQKSKLVEVFKDDPSIKAKLDEYAVKNKEIKTNRRLFAFFGLFNLILGIVLAGMGSLSPYLSESINIADLAQKNGWQRENDTLKKVTFAPDKPLDLTRSDKILQIYFSPTIPDSSECLAEIYFMDEQKNQIFQASNYSYQYNYGDTLKAESSSVFSETLRIDEPGKYYMSIDFKVPKWWKRKGQDMQYYLTVDKGDTGYDSGFMIVLGIFLIVISFFIRNKKI